MWMRPLEIDAVLHVAENMREWDRREIFATQRDDDIETFADQVMACGPVFWAAGLGNEPIAALGCLEAWPGMWSMWFFATDSLPKIGLSMTKAIKRSIVPSIIGLGANRMECRSMEGHVEAQRWLETLGASREATLKGYGRGGEDFHVYTWDCR